MHDFDGKRVTVAGLGKFGGGVAVAKFLVAQGARVLVTDTAPAEKLRDSLAQLSGLPIQYALGGHRTEHFTGADVVVTSPAVSPASEYLAAAIDAGVPVTTEIAIFLSRCPATVAAVTGTKGKSTTTALLHTMLASTNNAWLGGNIGISLLDRLPEIKPSDIVVLELSSFMLYWLGRFNWSPQLAVLTMIGSDHLDWHGSVAAYHDAKAQIVVHQEESDTVVTDAAWKASADIARKSPGKIVLADGPADPGLVPKLVGRHNAQNARLAKLAAIELGVDEAIARHVTANFKGLPHRLEVVHEADGVRWINDSIATIPEAAAAACEAFDSGKVIQIVGGSDKGLPIDAMCQTLVRHAKAVLAIGSTGMNVAKELHRIDASFPCEFVETLQAAVSRARKLAGPGDVVLLSTGFASYDQFSNFEHRGRVFAELARSV